jgi:hypothetical protein
MALAEMHPEDVKAALRKRFGSVAKFERLRSLPEKSVADLLRGRTSARVEEAVEAALNEVTAMHLPSEVSDNSADVSGTHRLNAGGR